MAEDGEENGAWEVRFREDEEMEFFTELALHETERWIQAVTRKKFSHPDDPRKSLENGILLCDLINCIRPGSVKRINKQATPIAGLDNLNVLLRSLKNNFGLQDSHLFDVSDLEDLSQRAIAESDQLKHEVDRRLRNVAITVYWLGKAVSHTFQGPQLDFSAFAPLVHHHSKDIISNDFRRDSSCSWESNEYSSAYGSHEGNSLGNIPENSNHHKRDSSYDSYASYEKRSEDSLDEQLFDNMPVRYGSQSGLNRSGDGMYADDRNNSMYRSSPDLSPGSPYHRRSSSNDSLDGYHHSSHSRQSSGSMENYATRPLRRTSSSTPNDPLQFVKHKGQSHLAKQAEEQIALAAIQKESKKPLDSVKQDDEDWQSVSSIKDEQGNPDGDDWQSNLSSWKRRRKSQSAQAYDRKEELDKLQEPDDEPKTSLQTKTFSQMQEERQRRKSAPTKSFYPVDDDEEDDVITPSKSSQQESSLSKQSWSVSSNKAVADWAQDSNSEGEHEDNNNDQTVDNKNGLNDDPFDDYDKSKTKPTPTRRSFGNTDSQVSNQRSFEQRDRQVSDSVSKQNSRNSLDSLSRGNKISDIRNRFEQTEEQPKTRSSTVDTKVNLRARMKSFERYEEDNSEPVRPARGSDAGSRNRYSEKRSVYEENNSRYGRSAHEDVSTDTRYSRNVENGANKGANQDTNMSSPRWKYEETTSNLYGSLRKSGRDYTEKNIKISQKPNSERGFGFTITGGVDTSQPVSVLKVTLGSAADVCEVMAKDEILCINRRDISSLSQQEVNNLIQDCVKSGQLELRVKRFLGSGDDEEDEFLSSDEELQESFEKSSKTQERDTGKDNSYDSRDSRTSQEDFRAAVNNNPVANALEEERQWIMDQQDYGDSPKGDNQVHTVKETYVERPVMEQEPEKPEFPELVMEADITTRQETEVEMRPSIRRARRERNEVTRSAPPVEEEEPKPTSSFEISYQSERQSRSNDALNDTSGSDDIGPPAILRKWQKRPRSEYKPEREPSPEKRLSSSLPWLENKLDDNRTKDDLFERTTKDFVSSQPDAPVPSPRRRFDDQKRQEDWNEKNERERKLADASLNDLDSNKEKFAETQSRIQQEYDNDIRRAQEIAREREQQEHDMLEPEMARMRVTEERRQERRMRLQQLQDSASDSNQLYQPRQSREQVQTYETQPTYEHQPDRSNNAWSQPVESSASFQGSGPGRPEILVIDPRNRGDDPQSDYNYHVEMSTAGVDLERIREEERKKIREEERRKREAEEERRFREKEAELQKQEEELRQKEERLRKEQERFHREQEELQRLRAEQNSKPDIAMFEAPIARVREASPSYQSTVTQKRPEVLRSNPASQYSTTVVVEPKGHYAVKSVSPSWQTDAIRGAADPSGRSHFSREDMLAMNRKATPLQTRPEITPPTSPTDTGPIKRQTPTRDQLHSLNAVPKPKFRSSQDWIGGDQNMPSNARNVSSKHSQIMRKQYSTPQEHWLYEEAERRRRANLDQKSHVRNPTHSQFSGPIRPTTDNRWRDEPVIERRQSPGLNSSFDRPQMDGNMPAAIRQTLLQKTAGARGSTGSNYSQDLGSYNQYSSQSSLSNTMPASYNYNSQGFHDQRSHEPPAPPSTRAPPPPENKVEKPVPLSGRQQCSHCSQELGYGAAMIIESLGLSYHVQCFKCCVCHTPLGNGKEGADVRVRVNKLHCPNCYSNDEGIAYMGKF